MNWGKSEGQQREIEMQNRSSHELLTSTCFFAQELRARFQPSNHDVRFRKYTKHVESVSFKINFRGLEFFISIPSNQSHHSEFTIILESNSGNVDSDMGCFLACKVMFNLQQLWKVFVQENIRSNCFRFCVIK